MATKIVFMILFVLDLLLTGFLGWSMLQANLISSQLVIIAALLVAMIPMLLFLLQREKKKQKKKTGFRVAAIVILLFMGIVEGAVGYYLFHYNNKMDRVTQVRTQYTQVEIYVLEDDKAQTLEYALERRYVFGVIQGADTDAIDQTRESLEKKYGHSMKLQPYETLAELVRAADGGEINAMLMSSAYLSLIDDLPDYEGFSEKLRVLHSSNVQTDLLEEITPQQFGTQGEELAMKDPDLWTDSFCAYVSGIDTFGPVTARSRSDVNILAIVNTKTKTVLLISTPRDYYVPFNFSPVNGRMDKLTHAGIYGIEGSMRALGDFYELPVHYYVRVNFSGFMNVIDTLGGVDVESDADFGANGYSFQKGMNHLNGKQALGFVRNRYSFLEGDRARGRHQMAVIKGVINGLMSSKIITNYAELLDEMEGCFQTNASKSMIGDLVQLTLDRSRGDWKVITYSVDGVGQTDYAYSLGAYAYCMVPNTKTVEYARQLVSDVLNGTPLTQEELQENAPNPRGD